ncbi:hypothetical protein ACET3Z_024635 [Daucus carota]
METSNSSFQKVGSQRDARSTTVVGYDEDARILIEKLKGGRKQLQFISVFGMAGLGKTTLVRKVFTEPLIEYHFHVRAWTTVTQEPKKRDLLLGILKSGFDVDNKNESDMELRATLKRRLSGRRYLVVMDDIWDSKDWNDLMLCFPDDNLGSRIVFTSRLADVPFKVHPGCYKYPLRFLSHEESWNLLRYRVFLEDSCPTSLIKIGQEIARNCKGLPLSLVVMAGILASDQTANWWNQVGEDTSSNVSNAPEQHMKTVELSYKHLPNHLKPCFLYFAAFPEDYEIPAWKLILLWMAEGLIKTTQTTEKFPEDEENSLEKVAAGYLNNLISRSLVMVSKTGSNGGIKACIVHDVLRDFCIQRASKANFLQQLPRYQLHVSNTPTKSTVKRVYSGSDSEKNFILELTRYFQLENLFSPYETLLNKSTDSLKVNTILCCNASLSFYADCYDFYALGAFRVLRVLDLSGTGLSNVPHVMVSLLTLRYVALCIKPVDDHRGFVDLSLPNSMNSLIFLETLIVHNRKENGIHVPYETWMLNRLKHLILRGNIVHQDIPDSQMHCLSNLKTVSTQIPLDQCKKILEYTPNLRKLGIRAALYLSSTKLRIPNLDKLQHLENLSLQNDLNPGYDLTDNLLHRELTSPFMFPATLKKLTLVCTFLKWDEMEQIGMLPNLEVLKLQCEAFRGEKWETTDGGFCRLKHLAFKFIKFVQWSAYSEQFPNLQHLKMDECTQLEEIPIGIGDIYTLERIEIRNCNYAVVQSAHKIIEDQLNKGNDFLKISVFQGMQTSV